MSKKIYAKSERTHPECVGFCCSNADLLEAPTPLTRWNGLTVATRVELRHEWVILTCQGECIHPFEVLLKDGKIFVMPLLDSSMHPYVLSMTCGWPHPRTSSASKAPSHSSTPTWPSTTGPGTRHRPQAHHLMPFLNHITSCLSSSSHHARPLQVLLHC